MSAQNSDALIPASNPLECPIPDEIPLARPPLKLALAQIRFAPILAINQDNSSMVAKFQDSVRKNYPNYRAEAELSVAVTPTGAPTQTRMLRHVFGDESGWEISLMQDFVTLTTTCYRNKDEFSDKIREVADAVRQNIVPHKALRLGVRFIDRIEGDYLQNICAYINAPFLGPHALLGGHAESMMSEALLTSVGRGGTMIVRWGFWPLNQPIPGLNILPSEGRGWILDADIRTEPYMGFEPDQLAGDAKALAGRAYAFFRGVFNDEFIRSCGGKL